MDLTFKAIDESAAGPKWAALFAAKWPAYRLWYLGAGVEARPTYAECRKALRAHMPEIVPIYDRLCELAGGGDLEARFLSLYRPPAFVQGCSQAAWTRGEPVLMRNYDFSPALCEGTILRSGWNGCRTIASVDCTWGVLDGVNDSGLALSLTFGGRKAVGDGFGIPVVLRYVLETCESAAQAAEVLSRVPIHMAYNITCLDKSGAYLTAYVSPDRETMVRNLAIATNHQRQIEWHRHARATATLERERYLFFRLTDPKMTERKLANAFLRPPLYSSSYENGFGTLYTAIYRPTRGIVEYRWPEGAWRQSFDRFEEGARRQRYGPTGAIAAAARRRPPRA